MVKANEISLNPITKTAFVSLFADTKGEVTSSMDIKGMPNDYTVEFGSSVITAAGELAFMKSDGTWNWV